MNDKNEGAKKILLIDDDQFLLDMYSLKLSQEGYIVQAADSVEEALQMLETGFAPDVIVFDIVMPTKSGFEFLADLREKNLAQDAVLVALTNQSADEEKKKAEELGADVYIVKANSIPSEVVNMITEAIQEHARA